MYTTLFKTKKFMRTYHLICRFLADSGHRAEKKKREVAFNLTMIQIASCIGILAGVAFAALGSIRIKESPKLALGSITIGCSLTFIFRDMKQVSRNIKILLQDKEESTTATKNPDALAKYILQNTWIAKSLLEKSLKKKLIKEIR